MDSFLAYRVHEDNGSTAGRLEEITLDDLPPGEVLVRVAWSDVNFKDALAATGKGKIMRRFPMVAGIDLAGYVQTSEDDRFVEGDAVFVTGMGLGEDRDGGYAKFARLPADWLLPLPQGLTLRESMAVGTAGFTAALAVDRMQLNGQTPELGPILVNGATGGVGSFAIAMLSGLGFEVTAFTGKRDQDDYLRGLGATAVVYRGEVELGTRPLEKSVWGGAVDSVGGDELGWLTRTVHPQGNIAAIGLAGGVKLNTTVLPFILRGVNLLGINSVHVPKPTRLRVWERLCADLRISQFDQVVTNSVSLAQLPETFSAYMDGTVTGRTLVEVE